MPNLHVLIGIPGSGKSTLAARLAEEDRTVLVSSDALRVQLTGNLNAPLDLDATMWPLFHDQIEVALSRGFDVIADATNLSVASRDAYLQHNQKVVKVIAHVMSVPFGAACIRNALRERQVPENVMIDMQARMNAEVSVKDLYDEGFDAVFLHDLAGDMLAV